MELAFLYQLQNVSFDYLLGRSAKISVIDMDDSGLDSGQIGQLQDRGQTLLTYLSIGEAEDYRDYWSDGDWGRDRPDFLLKENPDWEGNYRVKFWEEDWQEVIFDRVEQAVKLGYNGLYLDIVDAFTVRDVQNAYEGADIRQEMIDFVIDISKRARSLDPDFLIVPQNAVELLADPDGGPGVPNRAYLDAIDGVGVEDLWYDDNSIADWTPWDLEYIQNAQNAGKFVLATSYPTQSAKQAAFVANAIDADFVPFVGNRDLDQRVNSINSEVLDLMGNRDFIIADARPPEPDEGDPTPSEKPDGIAPIGGDGDDILTGDNKGDVLYGGRGSDELLGKAGDDFLYGGSGDDTLRGNRHDDVLMGEGGNDGLSGGNGHDLLVGGDGSDRLFGNLGNDRIVFDELDSIVAGGKGFDTLVADGAFDFDIGDRNYRAGFEALDLDNGLRNQVWIGESEISRKTEDDRLLVIGDGRDEILTDMGAVRDYAEVDGVDYGVFRSGASELLIEVGLTVNGEVIEWF